MFPPNLGMWEKGGGRGRGREGAEAKFAVLARPFQGESQKTVRKIHCLEDGPPPRDPPPPTPRPTYREGREGKSAPGEPPEGPRSPKYTDDYTILI